MWNDDYFEFLVTKVWQLNTPLNVVDFGCGYGFLAEKLMPLLPKGSTYTGIDISEQLIKVAKKHFSNKSYKTKFIHSDLNHYKSKFRYDLAICQAVLRHQPNAKQILHKMINSVVKGGRVVTIEINRKLEELGLYINNNSYEKNDYLNIMQKIWNYELNNDYRDYSIGFKIPFYMHELGLKKIDTRVNDKVNLFNNENLNSIEIFTESYGWHKKINSEQKSKLIKMLMSRGLTRADIDNYITYHDEKINYLRTNNIQVARAMCLLISTGIKPN